MKYVQLFITLKKVFNYRYFSLDVKADAPTILVVGSEGNYSYVGTHHSLQ